MCLKLFATIGTVQIIFNFIVFVAILMRPYLFMIKIDADSVSFKKCSSYLGETIHSNNRLLNILAMAKLTFQYGGDFSHKRK